MSCSARASLSGGQRATVLGLSLVAPAVVGIDKAIQLRRQRADHVRRLAPIKEGAAA